MKSESLRKEQRSMKVLHNKPRGAMNAELLYKETVMEVSECNITGDTHTCRHSKRNRIVFRNVLIYLIFFLIVSVGGWMPSNTSFLLERFCPDLNEWRSTAHVFNNRACVAVGALDGRIYTAGGEDKR